MVQPDSSASHCHLLDLSPEVRLIIYAELFTPARVVMDVSTTQGPKAATYISIAASKDLHLTGVSLLATCKLANTEATPPFFDCLRFGITTNGYPVASGEVSDLDGRHHVIWRNEYRTDLPTVRVWPLQDFNASKHMRHAELQIALVRGNRMADQSLIKSRIDTVIRSLNAAPFLRDVSIYIQVDRSTDRECYAGLMDSLRQVRYGLATETTLEQCREDAWDQWTTLDAKLKQIYDSVVGDIGGTAQRRCLQGLIS